VRGEVCIIKEGLERHVTAVSCDVLKKEWKVMRVRCQERRRKDSVEIDQSGIRV
jgi:hypothetical protein